MNENPILLGELPEHHARLQKFLNEVVKVFDYDPRESINSQHEWTIFLNDHGYEVLGEEYYEYGDIGMDIDWTIRAHWLGLNLAMQRLPAPIVAEAAR